MKILCVIPSRIGSTRLPRKPLLKIHDKPMIQWVYENAKRCDVFSKVIVATDNEEIAGVIDRCGGEAILTDPHIENGSKRVGVIAKDYPEMDVVVNLQGDEPFIKASMLTQLVSPYLNGETPEMTTLAYPLDLKTKHNDPGTVKVVTDLHGNALYFSRAPIPYFRTTVSAPVYNHMGLYAFTHEFLKVYCNLPSTPLEQAESLEQMRVLEHGYKIKVCLTQESTLEINTPEEYELAQTFAFES